MDVGRGEWVSAGDVGLVGGVALSGHMDICARHGDQTVTGQISRRHTRTHSEQKHSRSGLLLS
jgi:hypothetical protein